jgi:hypothetical protein
LASGETKDLVPAQKRFFVAIFFVPVKNDVVGLLRMRAFA